MPRHQFSRVRLPVPGRNPAYVQLRTDSGGNSAAFPEEEYIYKMNIRGP